MCMQHIKLQNQEKYYKFDIQKYLEIRKENIKMASNNIDENMLLKYVVFCFGAWGIKYITKDILKKCKDNLQECAQPLTHLLFDLSILQILQFQYSLDQLGIKIDSDVEFMQEFVLAYLSQANCPFLEIHNEDMHSLDFNQSRILLLIVGWLMAKTSFFSKIKTKLIDKKFSSLYIQKKNKNAKMRQTPNVSSKKNQLNVKKFEDSSLNTETIQRLFKTLNQYQFRLECLQNKKSRIFAKLNKQITQYNKKNQTNLTLESIICQNSNNQEQIQEEEDYLQAIIKQINNGMKNQSYFWMWLQFKVIQPEFKYLQTQFQDQFEKVEPPTKTDWLRMNPMYLSNYNKQYKSVSQRLQQINQYYSTIQPYLEVKAPKNEAALAKQVLHQTNKLLNETDAGLLQELGTPCFLKLQVIKYCQKKGFGSRNRKVKNKKANIQTINENQQMQNRLKEQIEDFISKLDQIKFI